MNSSSSNNEFDVDQDNLTCHHLLFIQDVTKSIYVSEKDYFLADSLKLNFKRVKLNGIIVAQKRSNNQLHIWIDDGTSVIQVILSQELLTRQGSDLLIVSNNVTLFGKVSLLNNEYVILCGGFQVQDNDVAEIYHWLKIMKERPTLRSPAQQRTRPAQHMFYTLSSNPSPQRLQFSDSPIRDDIISSQNTGFLWSPNHTFATSTPICSTTGIITRLVHMPQPLSPLRSIKVPPPEDEEEEEEGEEEEEEEDDFDDFASGDLLALENNPLLMSNHNHDDTPPLVQQQMMITKRKFDDLIG